MLLSAFLNSLLDNGQIVVSSDLEVGISDDVPAQLQELDRSARANLAFEAPDLDVAAATWAATVLCHGCQFLLCRDAPEQTVDKLLSVPCPVRREPATHYSVDLLFQYLPDLIALARRLAPNDPLVKRLLALATEWPLSSVGIEGVGPVNVDGFIQNDCLRQLYVDRVLAREDMGRAKYPRVEAAIKETLGAHPELCPSAPHV